MNTLSIISGFLIISPISLKIYTFKLTTILLSGGILIGKMGLHPVFGGTFHLGIYGLADDSPLSGPGLPVKL